MKILLVPDKFKGSMTALQVAEIEAEAIRSVFAGAEIDLCPLADGGEGTVETLTAALGGELCEFRVHDPLGRPVAARGGRAGKMAILEMASASGLELLREEERNPWNTGTYGTGELIRFALAQGAEELVLGIGGSATVDGGTGMAEALGVRFFDATGKPLSRLCGGMLERIDRFDVPPELSVRLAKTRIRIASDVTNPLLGRQGAATVFAPQKGAPPEMVSRLEAGLHHLAEVVIQQGMAEDCVHSGDGAAGGLGFGLRAFCGAVSESGARLALSVTGVERRLENVDWVITGEGRSDGQTEQGKLCSEVAALCRKRRVPCVLLSGAVEGIFAGFDRVISVSDPTVPFFKIRSKAELLLYEAVRRLAQEWCER